MITRGRSIVFVRGITLLLVLVMLSFSGWLIYADSTDVQSGRSYYVELDSLFDTNNWAGLTITNNGASLDETDTDTPFGTTLISVPVITSTQFPGDNLKDGLHYYAAMQVNGFNASNLVNVSDSDLLENGMFDSTSFSQFYPDYYNFSDNPNSTFCCNTSQVTIGGVNYTTFATEIETNIEYHVIKYDDGGTPRPLFIVAFEDQTCYDSAACVAQFMLPLSSSQYFFYVLSKFPVYDINVFIDDVDTDTFSQTGLPYLVRLDVTNAYTGDPAENVSAFIAEEEGQNLFVPLRLSGEVSTAYAASLTNSSGQESFVVAITAYPPNSDYDIYAGVLREGTLSSRHDLFVTDADSTVVQSKPLSPTSLYDNAKTAVNSLNQIVSSMFVWANTLNSAYRWDVEYNLNTDTFTYENLRTGGTTISLKTGALNRIRVDVTNGITTQSGYTFDVRESEGYVLMNPYTTDSPFDATNTSHFVNVDADGSAEIVVVPSSLGFIESNLTIEIKDSSGSLEDLVQIPITATLDTDDSDASSFTGSTADSVITLINNMNTIVSSLFTALNT